MAYELFGLLTRDASVTQDDLDNLVRKRFESDPDAEVRRDQFVIHVSWGDWSIGLGISSEPEVAEECRELAELYAQSRSDQDAIRTCRRRIEVSADDDEDMDHFNDYVFIIELLENIPGCVLFDPAQEKFVDEIKDGE